VVETTDEAFRNSGLAVEDEKASEIYGRLRTCGRL
jgi:hypothetical protein